ncbi:hypothetical protein D9M72_137360 [compost metagenome]
MGWWQRAMKDKGWHPVWIAVGIFLFAIAVVYVTVVSESRSLFNTLPARPLPGDSDDLKQAFDTAAAVRSAQLGQMGDAVGGLLNPVLTFLSCIGLLITIMVSLHAVGDTRELAAGQQRNERLTTMIAVLTTLYQAAGEDYEFYRTASGGGAPALATAARTRMREISELLTVLYLQVHREDLPEELVPKSILAEEAKRRSPKDNPKSGSHFVRVEFAPEVMERYRKILGASDLAASILRGSFLKSVAKDTRQPTDE